MGSTSVFTTSQSLTQPFSLDSYSIQSLKMRSYLLLGAAALVAASPAPQAFDLKQFDAIPNNVAQGPGAQVTAESVYNQAKAQDNAAAATGLATAQQAMRSAGLEARDPTFWWSWNQPQEKPAAPAPTKAPTTTAAPAASSSRLLTSRRPVSVS